MIAVTVKYSSTLQPEKTQSHYVFTPLMRHHVCVCKNYSMGAFLQRNQACLL